MVCLDKIWLDIALGYWCSPNGVLKSRYFLLSYTKQIQKGDWKSVAIWKEYMQLPVQNPNCSNFQTLLGSNLPK